MVRNSKKDITDNRKQCVIHSLFGVYSYERVLIYIMELTMRYS